MSGLDSTRNLEPEERQKAKKRQLDITNNIGEKTAKKFSLKNRQENPEGI